MQRSKVMNHALEFAKSITLAELDFISLADHGQDAEQHLDALKELIFVQDCVVTDEQIWFPYEVVELTRNICNEGHEREFAICNVIITLSIIAGADRVNEPAYMLDAFASEYDKLPNLLQELVVNLLIKADAGGG